MTSFRNKKSDLALDKLGGFVLVTISLVIIFTLVPYFLSSAEAKTTESICRGSVGLRDKSYTVIEAPVIGTDLGSVATPLLGCKTSDKYIPENKDTTKEDLKKEIADLMAKTWETFGEGRIHDVFKKGDQFNKNCLVFYTVSIRETSDFNGREESGIITSAEMRQYMFEHPYIAYPEGDFCKITGGFCENAENSAGCSNKINAPSTYLKFEPSKDNKACEKKNKKGCCYTEYSCWNKGGTCASQNPDATTYLPYDNDKWNCPKNTQCYIKKENYYSYGDYIQEYGGPGNMLVLADLKPGETYAVSFGSPTENCGWCTEAGLVGGVLGGGAGIAAGAKVAVVLASVAIPGGWIVMGTAALVGGGTGYIIAKVGSEGINEAVAKLLSERDINTIYLTTLNQIQSGQHCSIVS